MTQYGRSLSPPDTRSIPEKSMSFWTMGTFDVRFVLVIGISMPQRSAHGWLSRLEHELDALEDPPSTFC